MGCQRIDDKGMIDYNENRKFQFILNGRVLYIQSIVFIVDYELSYSKVFVIYKIVYVKY